MAQYIDKSILVAEIEKRIEKYNTIDTGNNEELKAMYGAKCHALREILRFLDTSEVKEVDLEKTLSDLDKDIKEFITTEEFERDSAYCGHYWAIAKHAFLLGLNYMHTL